MITDQDLLDNLRGQVYHLQQKLIDAQKDRDDFKLRLVESFAEKHKMWREIDDLKWRLEGFENNIEQAQKLLSGNKHVGKHVLCAAIDEIADIKARLEKAENECSGLLSLLDYERSMRRVERKECDSYKDERDAAIARAEKARASLARLRDTDVVSERDAAIRERDEARAEVARWKYEHAESVRKWASVAWDLDTATKRIARLVGLLQEEADRQTLAAYQGTGSWVDRVNREIGEKP